MRKPYTGRIFAADFRTDDEQKFQKALAYLHRIGITDIHAGYIDDEDLPDPPTRALAIEPPKPVFHLYAILRGSELGYIGGTSLNPPSQRVDQHLKRAKDAAEPLVRWLADGIIADDIRVQYWMTDAKTRYQLGDMEKLAIKKLKPLFNKHNAGLVAPQVEPPQLFTGLAD